MRERWKHYKKLSPIVPVNKEKLQNFRGEYWDYYRKLFEYKKAPDPALAHELSEQFDQLFSTETGYAQPDDRILKSKTKKKGKS